MGKKNVPPETAGAFVKKKRTKRLPLRRNRCRPQNQTESLLNRYPYGFIDIKVSWYLTVLYQKLSY